MIDHLDGRGIVPQDRGGCRQGFEQVGELNDQRPPGAGQLDQLELGFDRHSQRSLRADQETGEIEGGVSLAIGTRRNKVVQVVPTHAPEDLGKAGGDLGGMRGRQLPRDPKAGSFAILLRAPGLELSLVYRHPVYQAAVGQDGLEFEHMIDCFTINDRSRSGRIVGDHAADRRPVRGGDIGREQEAVGFERTGSSRRVRNRARRVPIAPGR